MSNGQCKQYRQHEGCEIDNMEIATEAICAGFMFFVIYMCKRSHIFRYYTKFFIFLILSLVSATVFIPVMLLQPRDYRNALLPAWGARQISKLLGLKWKMRGHQNIVQETGCVVLINHQSCIDLLVLAEIWPVMKRCTVISKREVFYLWPFGLASWLWGTVFIDRVNGPRAQETINKTAETINTKMARICIFPEGTRHGGNKMLPFKKGAFHIAISSQVPIQPVVVSRYTFLDSDQFIFDKGSSMISILPPIETKGLMKEDIEELMNQTYERMTEEYNKLNQLN